MDKKMTKRHCIGCRDDFYNGKNPLGVSECWSFKGAKLVKRIRIPIDLAPPYLHEKPETVPNCKRIPRYALVRPEAIGADGYWKR